MRAVLVATALVFAPRAALACPVCFGQSDSPMAVGTNMAVFFMLGVTGSVLAGFAAFVFYLARRARLFAARVEPAGSPADPPGRRHARSTPDFEEETAKC